MFFFFPSGISQIAALTSGDTLEASWKEQVIPFLSLRRAARVTHVDLCSSKYIYLEEIVQQPF